MTQKPYSTAIGTNIIDTSSQHKTAYLAHSVAVLTFAFSLRVIGQAIQNWFPVSLLPPFDDWQGSGIPYPALLASQVVILAIAAWVLSRMYTQRNIMNKRWCLAVTVLGIIYFSVMAIRIVLGLTIATESEWFTAWISSSFHLVLAAKLILISTYQRHLK